MTLVFRRFAICMLAFLMATPLCYAEDVSQAFAAALAANLSPVEEALATGRYSLRTGEAAVFPSCSGGIIPYDEQTGALLPTQPGEFSSSDPAVVTVDSTGKMTAIGEGTAVVAYLLGEKKTEFTVDVSAQNMPELAKAMVYVANEEYFRVHRARLPKYNQYAKWYYGKRKEVGWCSVFVIWCANQAGANPVKLTKLPDTLSDRDTLFLREGQV
ncbi:MAG: hypothetical protein EOM66_10920, partial [Clostridia bacterium]|nr:hypothetical protein [Clostridia bacterium]